MMGWWNEISFEDPGYFWFLLAIPVIVLLYLLWFKKRIPGMNLSVTSFFQGNGGWTFHIPFILGVIGLLSLVIALTRPVTSSSWQDVNTKGIDIVMAMDISASMLAKDFSPNRLEVSKEVASEFIRERPNDRVGLVVYEGESFTQCPLTTDHRVVQDLLKETKTGLLKGGTAIGMGLATSVNRLKDSKAKSKVIILLTDGVNNRGSIAPSTAAKIAKEFGIRVYTIGVGSRGKAPFPVGKYPNGEYRFKRTEVEIDEESLKKIADITGGKYFRATDKKKLQNIYEEIDKMEKTRIKVTEHSTKTERFYPFLITGGGLLLLGFALERTIFRSIP